MPDFNRVKPFRFWCQKVLPLVYDDSLSYYELLNKVVDYLNKTIEDVNGVIQLTEDFTEEQAQAYAEFTADIEQTVDTLTNAFNTLHDFVDNYFENLDVQEEIDNKLDEMALDGTLTNMVRPVAAAMIPGLVAQWLEDNITPTTPAVDRTLSVTGAAADAREVGYRLAWVGDSLNWVNNSKYDVATGEIGENNDYARTPRIKGNLNEIIGIRSFASVPDAHAVLLYKNSNYIGYFTYATVEGNENYFYFLPDGTVTTAIEHDEYAINWIKNETYPVYDWTLRRTKLAGDVTELKNEALNADLSLEVMGSGQAELKNIPLIISSFINTETGAFTPTTTDNWAGTDFIEIPEGCYKITSNATAPSANFGLAFYDKDKQFISGSGVATYPSIDIRVELNYKYIRFTNYNANGDHSNVQLFFLGNKYGLYNEDNLPLELAIGNATLLRGSYTLNSTVTLGENQQIRGADCTVVVGENGKIIMSDGSAISGVNFVGEWNPTRTHGNGTTYTSYGYVPLIDYSDLETGDSDALFGENKTVSDAIIYIPTTGAFNAKVEGCTFTGFDRLAIYAGGQRHTENDNPVICNNYFVDCRMGVYVASEFTRLSCNEYLRCIVGCTLLGGNGNNIGEVYKCCDCGFYFPTPGTAHNEITSCEFAHCGLAGVYVQEILARTGAQITGCQFADAPIKGLSVSNLDIVGCRIDTWISYQNGKGNSIICSNIGNAYMYSHVELFDVPGDTLISFNRGLGTVADSDVNWKLGEIESIEDDIAELQDDVAGLKEDLDALKTDVIYERKTETGAQIIVNAAKAKCFLQSDVSNLQVSHTGKNLLSTPYAYAAETTTTINGVSYTPHADGSITVVGTASAASNYQIAGEATALRKPIKAGTYTLSGCPEGGGNANYNLFLSGVGQGNLIDTGNGITFTINEDKTYYLKFSVIAGASVDFTIYPQIEIGTVKSAWKPYKGETITLTGGRAESNTYAGTNVFIAPNTFSLDYFALKESLASAVASLKDFGAIGDGVTDDTDAINAALAACEGKPLFIPEGVYIFSATLNVKSGTTLYGAGEKSIFRLADTFTLTPYDWRPEDGGLSLYKWGMIVFPLDSAGIILDNFVVEGQTAAFIDQTEVCIAARGSNHVIRNVITRDINYFPDSFSGRQYNAPGEGIEVFKAKNVIVENCVCETCGYEGIGTESAEDVTISNCKVGDTNQTGIQIHRSSKHIRVNNCTVDYSDSVLAGTAFTFHANVGVDMEDIHVCDNYLCKGVTLIGGAENDVYFINNTILDGALTRNGNVYRSNWFIRGNKFLSGGIVNQIDNCIITDNMLTVNAGYQMINMRGNRVIAANNVALGSVSGVYIETHDES